MPRSTSPVVRAVLILGVVFLLLTIGPDSVLADSQTYTVINTADSGAGSLRQAILDANVNPGLDEIHFNIPGAGVQTIAPTSALPEITDPVIIDGYTQPGTSPATESTTATLLIELSGIGGDGLFFTAGDSTVRGLVINGFANGIVFYGFDDVNTIGLGSNNNVVEGNYIGIDPIGNIALGNLRVGGFRPDVKYNGVVAYESSNNRIGGTMPAARNIIAGHYKNQDCGWWACAGINIIEAYNPAPAANNLIQGNYIGLNAAGDTPLQNWAGISVQGSANTIGGTLPGARNIVSGNFDRDIEIVGDDNVIQGNYIGLNAVGAGIPQPPSYTRGFGVMLFGDRNQVGGTDPAARNIISSHYLVGVFVGTGSIASITENRIEGNWIGTDATGTGAAGNGLAGVFVSNEAINNDVGGTTAGSGNLIVHNGNGVIVGRGSGTYGSDPMTNRILGNTIQNNSTQVADFQTDGLGININVVDYSKWPPQLDGPTLNDPGDADSGPNGLQNFPVLAHALTNTTSTLTVTGSLNSKADTLYRIEFFSNPTCDPSGYGEGETYLGYTEQTTNSGGDVTFSVSLNAVIPVGRYITATATGPEGTSEFSLCRVAGSARPDTVGIFRPSNTTFYLRNSNTTGPADITAAFGQTSDQPVAGDWDGDGVDTIGIYRTTTGTFFLKNANTTAAPVVYTFTLGNPGDLPMAGDWNGDGIDGAGTFRPTNGRLYLKNTLITGFADFAMVLGVNGDRPVAGDWNGDGSDSPGVYRPSNSRFYLTNQRCNCIVMADYQLLLGNVGDVGFAGDWNGDGISGVGVFRPTNGRTYLKNGLTTGFADVAMIYGIAGDRPIAGKWIAAGSAPQQAPEFMPGR